MSIKLLKQYKQETGLSQNQIAVRLGVSSTKVSQYLNDKYEGDVKAMDKQVRQLVEQYEAEKQSVSSAFVPTKQAKEILSVCELSQALAKTCIVIGDAGCGKTMAVTEYARTHNNVLLLEVDTTYKGRAILHDLCHQLGLDDKVGRSNYLMNRAVIEKLKGSKTLIIVDEAELLKHDELELIRRIADKAKIGVVLVGLIRLRANLKAKGDNSKQLFSRIYGQCVLPIELPDEDLRMIASHLMDTEEWHDYLLSKCHGNARRLDNLCRGVNRLSQSLNKPISEKLIDKCVGLLVG